MTSLFFVLIAMLGIVFTLLTFADEEEIVWPLIAFIVWLVAAVSMFSLEEQVSYLDATGTFTTTTVSYTGGWYLSLIFVLFAFINIMFVWYRVMERFKESGR